MTKAEWQGKEKTVQIWLDKLSQPIFFQNVTSTYQKGDLFCIYIKSTETVVKYPISNIFKVVESY